MFDTAAPPAFQFQATKVSLFEFVVEAAPNVKPFESKEVSDVDAVASAPALFDSKNLVAPLTESYSLWSLAAFLHFNQTKSGVKI